MHVHTYKHARILARTHVYAHRDRQRDRERIVYQENGTIEQFFVFFVCF